MVFKADQGPANTVESQGYGGRVCDGAGDLVEKSRLGDSGPAAHRLPFKGQRESLPQ